MKIHRHIDPLALKKSYDRQQPSLTQSNTTLPLHHSLLALGHRFISVWMAR